MKLMVGVKALITNEAGEHLFLKRSAEHYPGLADLWDIPGGRIATEETCHAALKREVVEEVGLHIKSISPLPIAVQDIFTKDSGAHIVRMTYLVEADGEPRLSDEHEQYRWMAPDTATSVTLDPYVEEVLADIQ